MKTLIFCLMLLFYGNMFSQINIGQKIVINSRASFGISYFTPIFYDQTVGYGIVLFENTTIGISLDLLSCEKTSKNMQRMINLKNTFFLEYRPFKKRVLSPIIRAEMGYQLYSNALNKRFNKNLALYPNNEIYYENSLGTFQSLAPFGMIDIGVSILKKNVEINFVSGYSFNQINYFIIEEKKSLFSAVSLSVGCSYRF